MSDVFVERIRGLDISIFQDLSQSTSGDRRSLLIVQNLVRQLVGRYHYLEVGSHLGGTLLPHLLDPLCATALSIDKRPTSQPDERGRSFDYSDNSTARMIDTLRAFVSEADLLKLTTFDGDASEVPMSALSAAPHFVFIDAEHTNRAVFSDFLSMYRHAPKDCIFAFHDAHLLTDGLIIIETLLRHQEVRHELFFLPDTVAVILLGGYAASAPALARHALDRTAFITRARAGLLSMIVQNQTHRG